MRVLPTVEEWRTLLDGGALDGALARLYGAADTERQRARYAALLDHFSARFDGAQKAFLLSAPGRTELCGNHTDHQRGRVLAAAVAADCVAVAAPNGTMRVALESEGYAPVALSLAQLGPAPEEKNSPAALLRGTAAWLARSGPVAGFNAVMCSDVPGGAGLSSSAACGVLFGACLAACAGRPLPPLALAQAAQSAENEYFGKPSGLMDQLSSAVGGLVKIDFAQAQAPQVERLDADFARCGLAVILVETGGSHAGLTASYAAIPRDMRLVAHALGAEVLGEVDPAAFSAALPALRGRVPDLALLRALHFFDENARVDAMAAALCGGDAAQVLALARASGRSSFELLQNVCPTDPGERSLALALALTDRFFVSAGVGDGRWATRVHGGGFAGTIQTLLPVAQAEDYCAYMAQTFGRGCCHRVSIRPVGVTALVPERAPAQCTQ